MIADQTMVVCIILAVCTFPPIELQYKLFGLCQDNNLMQAKKLLGGYSGTDLRVVLDCRDSHGKSYYDHATRLGHLQLAGFLQGLVSIYEQLY